MADEPEKPERVDADEITAAERQRIQKWFADKAQKAECPICRSASWTVLDHFVTPTILGGQKRNNMRLGGKYYPHFMLACQSCGNVQMINGIGAKVLDPSDPSPTPGAKS